MIYLLLCAGTFCALYLINILYITVFFHRGLAHESVQLSPWVKRFVIGTGNWVTGIDPKAWSCMHRMHHKYSDTKLDPHSPVYKGFFGLAHAQLKSYESVLTGLIAKRSKYTKHVEDMDFDVHWLNRNNLWYVPYVMHLVIALLIALPTGYFLLGACYWFGIMSHPVQGWMVNAMGHSLGYRNFELADKSTNNTFVAWVVMGEGFQNNHHRYPKSPRFSVRKFEYDMGYTLCKVLAVFGVLSIDRNNLPAGEYKDSSESTARLA